jgi:hypothetical protein
MKVCISLRDPATPDLQDGNMRSEPRWERQVLEACTRNPEVTEIYTAGYEWQNGKNICSKYKGKLSTSSPNDCILIIQDWNTSVINSHPFKAAVVNIFHGPWLEQKQEVLNAIAKFKGNIFFTMGFPVLYAEELGPTGPSPGLPYSIRSRTSLSSSHLENFTSKDNIYLLPVPGIPEGKFENNFNKTTLLWVSRLVFLNQLENSLTLDWSLSKLDKDPSLTLEILTGWEKHEVKDYINEQVVFLEENINDAFFKLNKFQKYSHLKNRVQVHCSLSWRQVLATYGKAKLLTTHHKHYGGPPLEASMHGVPFIGTANIGALGDCSEYLYTAAETDACDLLEKLLTDSEFYEKTAKDYYNYAVKTYSYDSFNKNLCQILKSRNII